MIGEIPTIISAKDIQQSLKFYRDVLGFDPAYRWPSEGPLEYVFLRSEKIAVWIVAEGMVEELRRTSLVNRDSVKLELRIEVDDVAETVGRLAQKGANPGCDGSQSARHGADSCLRRPRWQSSAHSS